MGKETRRASRCTGEAGAVLAEAALITPLFIFLLFGILEFGGLFRDYLTLNNAVQSGGRSAAIAGQDPDADMQIINGVKKNSSALSKSQVTRIVIWRASDDGSGNSSRKGPGSTVPAACATASVGLTSENCNVYLGSVLTSPPTNAIWSDCTKPTDPAQYWCPTTRKTALTGANSPPDYLGLWMQIEHPWVTGLFGKKVTLTQSTVVKLEPRSLK